MNTIHPLQASLQKWKDLSATMGDLQTVLDAATEAIASAMEAEGKLLACGNGGSAAESAHLTSELVGRFRKDRRALPAICLPAEVSALTSIGNDYGFEQIYSRQVEAHGRPGDVLAVFSTSGNSPNIVKAAAAAKACGMPVLGFLGKDGGALRAMCDFPLLIDSNETARIQEAHLLCVHVLCELLEIRLGLCE